MDTLAEQPTIHSIGLSPETKRLPDYLSSDTDLHSGPPILNKKQLHRMYPECFSGISKCESYEKHIKLEDNAKQVFHPVRKIALALGSKLEKELQNMFDQGISTPVGDGESD